MYLICVKFQKAQKAGSLYLQVFNQDMAVHEALQSTFIIINMALMVNARRNTVASVVDDGPDTIITKQRLCVEYVIPDYKSLDNPTISLAVSSQHECFRYCVSRGDCLTFQYKDGICELLSTPPQCMAFMTVADPGLKYVGLKVCDQKPPWVSSKPEQKNWQWMQFANPEADIATRTDLVKAGFSYAVRLFHKGLYLPGYYRAAGRSISRAAFPVVSDGNCICTNAPVEFLVIPNYTLMPFNAGDPVPANAVLAGHWIDGYPLYVVFGWTSATDHQPGFYNPNTETTYIYNRGMHSPSSVDIVLHP